MRSCVVLVMLLLASPASADSIGDVAKSFVTSITKLETDGDALGLAKDATGLDRRGFEFDRACTEQGCWKDAGATLLYGPWTKPTVTAKITKTLTGTSGDVGWFHVTLSSTKKDTDGTAPEKRTLRVSALATRTKDAWSIHGVGYSEAVPDAELASRRRAVVKGEHKVILEGDTAIATTVAGWYKTGLAAQAGPSAQLVASGSAPGESAQGAAALRLARAWDKLRIAPFDLRARRVDGGKAVWVQGSVMLPRKGKKLPSVLQVTMVLVPDSKDATKWRWGALHYFSPEPAGIEDVMDDERLILLTPLP